MRDLEYKPTYKVERVDGKIPHIRKIYTSLSWAKKALFKHMIDNQEQGYVVLSENLGYLGSLYGNRIGLVRLEHGGIVEIETFDDDGELLSPIMTMHLKREGA